MLHKDDVFFFPYFLPFNLWRLLTFPLSLVLQMKSISHCRDTERLRGPSLAGNFAISWLLQNTLAKGVGMDFSSS